MRKKRISPGDISKNPDKPLESVNTENLLLLPPPYDKEDGRLTGKALSPEQSDKYECSLDGVAALSIPRPKNKQEEAELVRRFLSGLGKLLSRENNWTFLQPLTLALEFCVKCLTCSEACPIYLASGKQEIYRPSYRSEVLRRLVNRYLKGHNEFSAWIAGNDVELNWTTVARLAELAYRCTLCRRCTQSCPCGIDNGLVTHELRKLFSQEMGIVPKELHEQGTVKHLTVGSSTGMSPAAFKNIKEFMEEEIEERTGRKIEIPVDREGADILLFHNAGEFLAWPENPEAFAIIFDAAGLSWTMSSDMIGYDSVNYGLWYDDVQFARIVLKQAQIARDLKVKRIVVGECGHSHKAIISTADRLLGGDLNIPRQSCLPLLEEIVFSGRLKFKPKNANFPVTLHDPCNIVRSGGIVRPQRRILSKLYPQFREMVPHGVDNYCCGGGSGLAIMNSLNFTDWKLNVASRLKFKQILDTFQDVITPDIRKYVCAPCSNCKGTLRDLFTAYGTEEKCNITYTGLAEMIADAMAETRKPFLA